MGVGSLRGEDPLEKKMATCSSTLAYKIPWTKEPCGLSQWSCKELDTTEHTCKKKKSWGVMIASCNNQWH